MKENAREQTEFPPVTLRLIRPASVPDEYRKIESVTRIIGKTNSYEWWKFAFLSE